MHEFCEKLRAEILNKGVHVVSNWDVEENFICKIIGFFVPGSCYPGAQTSFWSGLSWND